MHSQAAIDHGAATVPAARNTEVVAVSGRTHAPRPGTLTTAIIRIGVTGAPVVSAPIPGRLTWHDAARPGFIVSGSLAATIRFRTPPGTDATLWTFGVADRSTRRSSACGRTRAIHCGLG